MKNFGIKPKISILVPHKWLLLSNINIKIHSKMKELVKKIEESYAVFKENAEAQVEKGNKAAGARARKAALELMKDFKEFRKVSVEESKK